MTTTHREQEAEQLARINRALAASKRAWQEELGGGAATGRQVLRWIVRAGILVLGGAGSMAFYQLGNMQLSMGVGGFSLALFILTVLARRALRD